MLATARLRTLLSFSIASTLACASACDSGKKPGDEAADGEAQPAVDDDETEPEPEPEPEQPPADTGPLEAVADETGEADADDAQPADDDDDAQPTDDDDDDAQPADDDEKTSAASATPKKGSGGSASKGGNAEQLAAGKELFRKKCKTCHGLDGKGSDKYREKVPDLPSLAKTKLSKAKVVSIVTDGVPDTKMKAYKSKLEADEIEAVSVYVKSL